MEKEEGFKMDKDGLVKKIIKCGLCSKDLIKTNDMGDLYEGHLVCEDEFCMQRANVRRSLGWVDPKIKDKNKMVIDDLKSAENILTKVFESFNKEGLCAKG